MTLNATCLVLICRCRCLERGWLVQTGCMSTGPVCCEALELGNSIKFRAILWSFTFQLLYSMAKAILGAGDARSCPNIESAVCTDKRESHSTRLNPVFSTCKSPCGFNLPRLLPCRWAALEGLAPAPTGRDCRDTKSTLVLHDASVEFKAPASMAHTRRWLLIVASDSK